MPILRVERVKEYAAVTDTKGRTEPSTIGKVTLTDGDKVLWEGYSCENGGADTDTPNQDKRIVAREYNLEWTATSKNTNSALGKWQRKALWVTCDSTLPSFRPRRILVHVGNFPSNTEGCILLGKTASSKGAVNSSVQAIIEVFDIIDRLGAGNVKLIVENKF